MIDLVSHRTADIPAPADVVWEVIADFGTLADWWPAGVIEKVELEGAGIGMVRAIHTNFGIVLRERLEALDSDEHRIELSISGDLPVGMCDYTTTGLVVPKGPAACTVDWTGCCRVPDKAAGEGAREFMERAYAMMFKGVRDWVQRKSPTSD